jgi:putative endonuclease
MTNNLNRRIKEHEQGKVKSTLNRRPLELIYYQAYPDKLDTEKRERYLKSSKGKRTLKLQLKNFLSTNV